MFSMVAWLGETCPKPQVRVHKPRLPLLMLDARRQTREFAQPKGAAICTVSLGCRWLGQVTLEEGHAPKIMIASRLSLPV